MADDQRYRAFISYSHADEAWGRWLHRRLERYAVPRSLIGQKTAVGAVPRRLFPIFRDREELPTASELGSVIESALQRSDFLIVICSPRSARSQWVEAEIKRFKQLGKADRVLALIVDGEPNAGDKPGELEECFPSALRFVVDGDGELTDEACEPIAADAREGKDGKTDAFLKLAAGLLGVGYDQLKRRDQKRRQQRAAFFITLSVALTVVFAAISVAALQARSEAVRERDRADSARVEAEEQRDIATEALAKADREFRRAEQQTHKSLRTLTSLLENKSADIIENGSSDEKPQAGLYLAKAMEVEPDQARRDQIHAPRLQAWALANPAPEAIVQFSTRISCWLPSPDGSMTAVVCDNGDLTILDESLRALHPPVHLKPYIRSPEGLEQVVQIYWEPDHAAVWTIEGDGRLRRWPLGVQQPSHSIESTLPGGMSPDAIVIHDGVVGITYRGRDQKFPEVIRWRLSSGGAEIVFRRSIPGYVLDDTDHLLHDDQWLVGQFDNYDDDQLDTWGICDLADGSFQHLPETPKRLMAINAQARQVICLDQDDQVVIWSVSPDGLTKTPVPRPTDDEDITAVCIGLDHRMHCVDRDWLHCMDGQLRPTSHRMHHMFFATLSRLWQLDATTFLAFDKRDNELQLLQVPATAGMRVATTPVSTNVSIAKDEILIRGQNVFFADYDRTLRRVNCRRSTLTRSQPWPEPISAIVATAASIIVHQGPDLYLTTDTGVQRCQPVDGRDILLTAQGQDRTAVVTPDHRIHVTGWPRPDTEGPDLHRLVRAPPSYRWSWRYREAVLPRHRRYGLICMDLGRTRVAIARDSITGAELWRSDPQPSWISQLTSTEDGKMIAGITKERDADHTLIHRWHIDSHSTNPEPVAVPGTIMALAFHRSTVIAYGEKTVHYLNDSLISRPLPDNLKIGSGVVADQPIAAITLTHTWVIANSAQSALAVPVTPDGTTTTIKTTTLPQRPNEGGYGNDGLSAVHVLADDTIIVGTRDGRVGRFTNAGELRWSATIPTTSKRPPHVDRLVPLPNAAGIGVVCHRQIVTLSVLDLDTGTILQSPQPIPERIHEIETADNGFTALTSTYLPGPQHEPLTISHFTFTMNPWSITMPQAGHCSPITAMAWFDDELLSLDARKWIQRHRLHDGAIHTTTVAPVDDQQTCLLIRSDLMVGFTPFISNYNSHDGKDHMPRLISYRLTDTLEPVGSLTIDHRPDWMDAIDASTDFELVPLPGDRLMVINGHGALRLFDLPDFTPLSPWQYHRPGSRSLDTLTLGAHSPSGNLLATSAGNKSYRLWDTNTLQPVSDVLPLPDDSYRSFDLSPDGTWLAIVASSEAWILEAKTGQIIGSAPVTNLPLDGPLIHWPDEGPPAIITQSGLVILDWWPEQADQLKLSSHPTRVTGLQLNDSLQPVAAPIPGPGPGPEPGPDASPDD